MLESPRRPVEGPLGVHSVPYVPPPDRVHPLIVLAGHPQGLQAPSETGVGSSNPGGGYEGMVEESPPNPRSYWMPEGCLSLITI